jgi:hypothetical protein
LRLITGFGNIHQYKVFHTLSAVTNKEGKVGRMKIFFAIVLSLLVMNSLVFAQDAYFQFKYLCQGPVDVGSSWTKLDTGTHSFTKNESDTEIEVHVNSRFYADSLSAFGIRFQVRIDDVIVPDYDNEASILGEYGPERLSEFLSIFAVFADIPAGSHTVSIWARTGGPVAGSAWGVYADPGCWGGSIIVKVPDDDALSMVPGDPGPEYESRMHQNYPNPFNPQTKIEYTVRRSSPVELKIYNALGQLVKTLVDDYKNAGEYSVVWDGKNNSGKTVPSGSYFYRIKMGDFTSTKKMIHIK